MADAPKILGTDSLKQSYPKLNSAIDNANEALNKSTTAETNSTNAVSTANSVQQQFNQVVIEGDSSVEAAQARINADGTTFTTLKDRLDNSDKKTSEWITPENFGAVGDGIVDDKVAIQNAINEASTKKKRLKFGIGKTYLISGQLLINSNSHWVGDANHRPVIKVNNQSFDPIVATGSLVGSTTVTASMTVNTKWLDVANASLIQEGMLIEIVSSLPWYHDPRTESSDCRKAELHRVDEIVGNRVYVTDPLMDGYDLTAETVTVNIYNPIQVTMKDIDVVMTLDPTPNDSIRKTGITLKYTIDSTLENVNVTNAVATGILLWHSYRPTVVGGRTVGAQNYFSGYGLQTYGTTHARIANRHARNCRRGVDVSGGKIPSHFTIVEGCSVFGNGINSLDNRYVFNDNHTSGTHASGIGTHGGADHTIIRNNYMGFLEIGVVDRSRNTTIENNYFVGDFGTSCIDVSYGINGSILGNQAYDGFTAHKERDVFDGGANYNTRKAPVFIRYQSTAVDNGATGGYFRVENNFAMIQHAFIELYASSEITSVNNINNFLVKGNHAIFTPQASADSCAFIKKNMISVATNVICSESTFKDNTYKRGSGTGALLYFDGVDSRNTAEIDSPKTFSFYISDDTATSVYFGGSNMLYVMVLVSCAYGGGLIRLSRGTNATWNIGTPVNIEAQGVALTGTTGTDGRISLAYTSDGKLHVENRAGSTQRIGVTILNYF
jgi:hypothetical protein